MIETTETLSIAGRECVTPDGGLKCSYPRIRWQPTDEKVFLDGNFSPEELRAIADFMVRDRLLPR